MISYSQHGEDVVLARLFDAVPAGVWVDVGAGHPVTDSVTKHLSDRGWWGCNLEPDRPLLAALEADRPHDRNLGVAASDRAGRATLHVAPVPGRSTLREDLVDGDLGPWATVEVELVTVAAVLAAQGIERLDLLKVDAEGHEAGGARRCRPGPGATPCRPRRGDRAGPSDTDPCLVGTGCPGRRLPLRARRRPQPLLRRRRRRAGDRVPVSSRPTRSTASSAGRRCSCAEQLVAVDEALARLEDEVDELR